MPNNTIRILLRSLIFLNLAVSATAFGAVEPLGQAVYVADAAGRPVTDAVVWFSTADGIGKNTNKSPFIVDQIDKQFVPQLSVIQVGDEVSFPNSDSVSHHVYSFSQQNSFELPLYRGGETPKVRFEHAGIVTLGCNIHDAMLGYILILDTNDFAITDKDGIARFSRVPTADTAIGIWSPRLNATKALVAERIKSEITLLSVRVPLRLQPQPGVSHSSLAWEDY